MADYSPPDTQDGADTGGARKSGKVADFRYKRSPQPEDGPPVPGGTARAASPAHVSNGGNGSKKDEATTRRPATQPPRKFGPYRPHGRRKQAYAALDLGTNNCRLLIARPSGENFTVIDAFSRVVKLGEDLATTGMLSDEAMDRAVAALKICAEKLRRRNVHLARSVATEACRRASNGDAFIERVREETGIVLDIITAEEEARLAVLGCHVLLEAGGGPAVIFDIGGGSTELVLIEPADPVPRILDWQSVPWGVVSLTDTVGRAEGDAAQRLERYEEMRRTVRDSFDEFAGRIAHFSDARDIRLLGTSGTVTTLASLHLKLPQYDRQAVDGLIVRSRSMREISARLSGMAPQDRRELPCIGDDRADLVVAGCAILESILDIWPAEHLGVADRGIREGILRSLIAANDAGEEARRALRDPPAGAPAAPR